MIDYSKKGYFVGKPETADGRRECELLDRDGNDLMLCQVMDLTYKDTAVQNNPGIVDHPAFRG